MEYTVIGVYGEKTPHEQRGAIASAQPEFRAWLVSMGCPARIADSVKRKNAALIERRSQIGQRGRQSSYLQDYYKRLEQDTAKHLRRVAAPPEEEDAEGDARRRRLMQAIM
jgi:hypothetical protein